MKRILLLLPLLISSHLFAMTDVPFLLLIDRLIAQDSSIVHRRFIGGNTALHLAAPRGAIRIMQKLINHGADVNAASDSGITPLHLTVIFEELEAAELLLANGANPNLANSAGITPLHVAADLDNIQGTQLLLSYHARTKQRSNIGMFIFGGLTPLQMAVINESHNVIPIFEQWHQEHEALVALSSATHPHLGHHSPARNLDQQSLSLIAGYVLNLKKPLNIDTFDKRKLFYRSLFELAALGLGCVAAALLPNAW